MKASARRKKFEAAQEWAHRRYEKAFRKLADFSTIPMFGGAGHCFPWPAETSRAKEFTAASHLSRRHAKAIGVFILFSSPLLRNILISRKPAWLSTPAQPFKT